MEDILNKEFNMKDLYENPENYDEFLSIKGYLIYRIHNLITNKSYIGDTEYDLWLRLFWFPYSHFNNYDNLNCDTHLYNSMRFYGLENFAISIISLDPNDSEAKYIKVYDSYHNGYNNNLSGKGEGWKSCAGRVPMRKDPESHYKNIKPSEVDYYLSLGWIIGRGHNDKWGLSTKDKIIVHKDNSQKFILLSELDSYLNSGWSKGRIPQNRISITNGIVTKVINASEFENYQKQGFTKGRLKSPGTGKTWIHDSEGKRKLVDNDKLGEYLSNDWIIGMDKVPKIWVHKGDSSTLIDPNRLEEFKSLGYSEGQYDSKVPVWIYKGDVCTKCFNTELNKYLSEGWIKGIHPDHKQSIWIVKENESKKVSKVNLDRYLAKGWKLR